MTALNILHIDDEPDIREIVEMSLGLDPEFSVRGSASGHDGIAAAAVEIPDLILLDVMMPVMDGPATLSKLRRNPITAFVPVIFMTARAQSREIEQFKSLGAIGVIAKPFDPMTLAVAVRKYVQLVDVVLGPSRRTFMRRMHRDAEVLLQCWSELGNDTALAWLVQIRDVAHGLAGASGIFGYPHIGDAASYLEEASIRELNGAKERQKVERALERLLTNIETDVFGQIKRNGLRFNA